MFYWTLLCFLLTVSPTKCQYYPNSSSVSGVCARVYVCVQCVKINWACLHCRGAAPSLHSHSAGRLSLASTVKANSDCLRTELCAIQPLFLGMGGWEAKAPHFPQPMTREGGAGNRCISRVCISTCTLTHTHTHTHTHKSFCHTPTPGSSALDERGSAWVSEVNDSWSERIIS